MIAKFANWWVARVTFERRTPDTTEFLPDHCQGAAGWMASQAQDGDAARGLIEAALNEVGLRLLAISDQSRAASLESVRKLDAHLAKNLANLEPGKSVVWGTIRTYLADGEA